MESSEPPVVSGTDDGQASTSQQQEQQTCPSQSWNSLSHNPPCVQLQSLGVRSVKEHQAGSPASRQQQREEEVERASCGEENNEVLDDLDAMEIDGCFPSLQPITGLSVNSEERTMPTLVRQHPEGERGAGDSGSEEEEEENSDVENLDGEIVYQPDGSAYIVENRSQLSQGESKGSSVHPHIISSFHIASSLGKWFDSSDHGIPSSSGAVGSSPVLHSFCVFDVRHESTKDYLRSDGSARKSCVSKDVPNNVDLSRFDGQGLYGKRKPILMCFLCRLSFGCRRSFVTHAMQEHCMTLNEDERQLLAHKHTSAIIQGIGKNKEPLISFLEPKNRSSPEPASFYSTYSGVQLEQGSEDTSHTPPTGSAKDSSEKAEGDMGEALSEEEELLLGEEEEEEAAGGRPAVSNQSISKSLLQMPSSAPHPSASPSCGQVSSDRDVATEDGVRSPEPPSSFNCQGPSATSRIATDESANQHSATALEPNDSPADGEADMEEEGGAFTPHPHHALHPHHHHHHAHPGGVECPKCDTVLGSSRSLGGHMTMMHSRNSCKTLKCPKCNWHYKYQQTLEAHMKEKHPDSGSSCLYCSNGQSHPRLARGESYTCGYKPFRCDVCNYSTTTKGNLSIHMQSDKHLNNMQTLQNGGSLPPATDPVFSHTSGGTVPVPSAAQASAHHHHHHQLPAQGGACRADSPTKPKSKPTWRCEVCDYETNVARNLRIHMTSEKHMHNVVLLQQNVAQMQHGRLGLAGLPPPSPSDTELYQYYLSHNVSIPPGLKMDPTGAEAQFLLAGFHLEPSIAALAPTLGGEISVDMRLGGGPLVSEDMMSLGESLSQTSDPSLKLFQCAVCNRFSTDSLEALGFHLSTERSLAEAEWHAVLGDSHQCKLCHYTTQLKANFQLHCKTDKHVQKYQLVAHIKEGGKGNEWRLKCVAIGNPVHLKCNACDYYTNSLEKLRLHTVNSRHEASQKLYKHLQQHEHAVEGEAAYYHCALCSYSTKAKLNLVQHVRSMKHQRSESLRKLQRMQRGLAEEEEELGAIFTIRKCFPTDTGEPTEDAEATSEEEQSKEMESEVEKEPTRGAVAASPGEKEMVDSPLPPKDPPSSSTTDTPSKPPNQTKVQAYQCPYCKYSSGELKHMRIHVTTQHSVQPTYRCPLCQDSLNNKMHLQFHLTHLHSVAPTCVSKLVATVMPSELPESMFISAPENADKPQTEMSSDLDSTKTLTENTEADLEKKSVEVPGACKPSLDDHQTLKEDIAGFLCWKKGCNQAFKSSSALHIHFNETHNTHNRRTQLPVSERHVYKYRCNQCSLAFKTIEKLQLHSQYHIIRAATMCCLCQRSFRTIQALKKHLESSHLELSDQDVQQLYGSLLMNGDLTVAGDPMLGEEQGVLGEEDDKVEDSDPEEKQSLEGSDFGCVSEDSALELKRALPFRKGPNFTMEKFLDPSRPFKCTVCKESFTQKNILLVHYNSVSHLHKVKRALQESNAGQCELASSPDNKPFKCSTCNVAYSQSSTLEIHMRSVLHQTKARAAKLDVAGVTSPSPHTAGGSGGTSSTSPSNPSPKPASCSAATTNNNNSSSGAQTTQNRGNHLTHNVKSLGSTLATCQSQLENDEKKKKFSEILSSHGQQQHLQQQQLVQAQAQLQQELQQQAALLQSQLFNPALLQHFPMTAEALLPLQQQQLLFPFYIPGAEFQLNPEINLTNSALGITGSSANSLLEELKNSAQQSCMQQQLLHHHNLQQQAHGPMAVLQQNASKGHQVEKKAKPCPLTEKDTSGEKDKETNENTQALKDETDNIKSKNMKDHGIIVSGNNENGFPPRIASDARGNATKALLENFGFELVIQYNENKQKVQKKPLGSYGAGKISRIVNIGLEKLECEACGKLFSNILILKSHQEHIHQAFFPFPFLERFAKEYREKYDKLYPIRPQTPEVAQTPAAPPPPPQRVPTPNIPVSTPSLTPPGVPPPQSSVSIPQITMPLDLISPLVMQSMSLQSLPSQMPAHLQSLETGLASNLAQLYQQQLTPAMIQQQNKRPRTRITDDQLSVLRQHFDINNSPNEDQIKEMADKSGLPQKVIKHWFRNTLFKERQRNKDSPYNFSNPPITTLEDSKADSKPPSPEYQRHDHYGSKRSSRTRFTDYQLRVLQDFFDANAYPKDDEFEQLSNLLSLSTRVIVVWFQNARQKARKNYENQGEGAKEVDRRELSNDRYIRTANQTYQCKKCNLVFQRIFDLIKHQKKVCYKDEDEEGQYDSQSEDTMDVSIDFYTPSRSSCQTPTTTTSSNLCPCPVSTLSDREETSPLYPSNSLEKKPKHSTECPSQENKVSVKLESPEQEPAESQLQKQTQEEKTHPTPKLSPVTQKKQPTSSSTSQPSTALLPSSHMILDPLLATAAQQQQLSQTIVPYQCEPCKMAFPSFEHWQEHQQLHFLTMQNQFIHPQFLDRPMDMSFMLFDPTNPVVASPLLSGSMPPGPTSSATSPSTTNSALNSLKRKLEEKPGVSPGENDIANSAEEPQRDKRLRTTITPEQLEVLYQKYLLDSNPTRKMLDHIADEVGLKKRVVQVWFQNTRARERKGQFRAVGPTQAHRRCPFCRALFKAKTALEAHIRSRHWHEAKQAGYSLTMFNLLSDQEGTQPRMDPLDMVHFSQLSSFNNDGHCSSLSPVNKIMDLSPCALISRASIKGEGMEDFENPSMSSVSLSFDQSKLDNDDCSSVNTAITDTTTGDEAIADNDSSDTKHGPNSTDFLLKSGGSGITLDMDDQMSSELVSPATGYYTKDYENDALVDYSETSSLADPCSPSPGASGSRSTDSGDRPGQKRYRTQMTNLQLKLLKSCFNDYRTPTMLECEVLGNDIGLPKRVVQVWFQNARAKEKKAKLSMAKHFGINQTSYDGPKTECTLCGVKYSARLSVRDHIFSNQHISKVKDTIGSQLDKEKEYFDPATVRQLMAQQEIDCIKKANEVLGLAQQQGMFENPALQALNLSSAYSSLPGMPPVLLPGVGNNSLPGFTSSNTASTPPQQLNILGLPVSSVPSPSLPISGLPNKPPSFSTLASSNPVQTSNSSPLSISTSTPSTNTTSKTAQSSTRLEPRKEHDIERSKDKLKEKNEKALTPSSTSVTQAPSTSAASAKKEKSDVAVPATSMSTPGMEYVVDPSQLQALQAALGSDPTALLTSQFLPYFMPGFSPYYAPQIPSALQGGYLQPMYSMESLFPYNPALSQALIGLSPGSLLQHYQQYQQSLQEALQQQQQLQQHQQKQQPKVSQTPVSHQSRRSQDRKESAKDGAKAGNHKGVSSCEASSPSSSHRNVTPEQQETSNKSADPLLDQLIVPKVQCRLACRKCQTVFSKEDAAIAHLKSICFFGQSVRNPQELLLRIPAGGHVGEGNQYDCLGCETTLDGDKALVQHLESALHKHRTIKRPARNAKEHPTSFLPHSSACVPDPSTTSTSQSAPCHDNTSPPPQITPVSISSSTVSSCSTAAGQAWSQAPFCRALSEKTSSRSCLSTSAFSPTSSSPTVTSSSLSTSGVQTSIPTDVFTDESDSESSQKSAGQRGQSAAEPAGCLKDTTSSCCTDLMNIGTDSIRS